MATRRCVLFDLDGTLTRSEEGIWKCFRHTAKTMGFSEPGDDVMRKLIGPPLAWSFRNLIGVPEERIPEALATYRARYNTVGYRENRVFPGVRALFAMLKKRGDFVAVVTGKPEPATRKVLEYFDLEKWVDGVSCATDGHAEKDALIRAVLPEDAGEVWMVGDRCFDIEGGITAGVHTLGVAYGYGTVEELRDSGAEKIAMTVGELREILCPGDAVPAGAFLSIEGLDGSGKGTQIEKLTDMIDRFGFEVVHSREPGGTPIGEKVREILLSREDAEMTDITEALLFAASRAQHVREVIRPAVAAGKVLLCDRFVDSSAAYQGGGRQLGVERVLAINAPAVDGTLPLATVYLDIGHTESLRRRCAASEPDRLEMETEQFHARVEAAYHELIARDPERFIVVDATGDRDAIGEEIAARVLKRLTEAEK